MELTAIEQQALNRAQAYLKGIGAQWAIRLPNGETLGELEVKERARSIRSRKPVRDYVADIGYIDDLRGLQPGGLVSWTVGPDKDYASGFEATVRAWCNSHWGKQTYIMTMEQVSGLWKISVLRG